MGGRMLTALHTLWDLCCGRTPDEPTRLDIYTRIVAAGPPSPGLRRQLPGLPAGAAWPRRAAAYAMTAPLVAHDERYQERATL